MAPAKPTIPRRQNRLNRLHNEFFDANSVSYEGLKDVPVPRGADLGDQTGRIEAKIPTKDQFRPLDRVEPERQVDFLVKLRGNSPTYLLKAELPI
jgi:hypothetical protein